MCISPLSAPSRSALVISLACCVEVQITALLLRLGRGLHRLDDVAPCRDLLRAEAPQHRPHGRLALGTIDLRLAAVGTVHAHRPTQAHVTHQRLLCLGYVP